MAEPESLPPEFQPVSLTDPLPTFKAWLEEAEQCTALFHPLYMCLSTASNDGQPHSRPVCLGPVSENGIEFITWDFYNKVRELEQNPRVSACVNWEPLYKFIRVEGEAERLSPAEVSSMFQGLGLRMQCSLICSASADQEVKSRAEVHQEFLELLQTYEPKGEKVPTPKEMIGYRIAPTMYEFYNGHPDLATLIHACDRVVFTRESSKGKWCVKRVTI